MHKPINYLAALLLLLPLATSANIITGTGSITASGTGSVDYTLFSQVVAGGTTISVNSEDFDTYVYLFADDGSLDSGDLITSNDDRSFFSLNSRITRYLGIGSYILAVSDYNFYLSEAVSGLNTNNRFGDYDLRIASWGEVSFDSSSVPEPTTLSLLGLGLLGAGISRRRAKK